MKLSEEEIQLIKEEKHPFYLWRPKPKIWKNKK